MVLQFLPLAVSQWGKLKIEGGSDTVHAANAVHHVEHSQDAIYVRVSIYVYAHTPTECPASY